MEKQQEKGHKSSAMQWNLWTHTSTAI